MSTETEGNGGEIYGLMATVLAEVGSIAKTRSNQQQGYKFRGIDDVYKAVHPLFAKHRIFTIPRILNKETTERVTATGTVLRFVEVSMAYDFFAPDGSHVTAEVIGEAMDSGDKASNKAMSAAQKYALIQTLCIPTTGTPDADATTPEEVLPGAAPYRPTQRDPAPNCPDCDGPMWDNRDTKKGKQSDFKCKDKACNKAVWVNSAKTVESKLVTQAVVDAFKVLNQAGDTVTWTTKTSNEFVAEHFDGKKIDGLNDDETQALLKMLSDRLEDIRVPF